MPKPGRIGRPPNQPTNHTIYGSWEGAQVLLLVLRGLPDLPYLGGRFTPAHLLSHSKHAPLTSMHSEDRLISSLAHLETSPHTFHKVSTQTHLLGRIDPCAQDFKACDALFSHLERSSRVRSRISGPRLAVTWRLQPGKFSGRPEADNQPTNLIGVTSRYLEHRGPRSSRGRSPL